MTLRPVTPLGLLAARLDRLDLLVREGAGSARLREELAAARALASGLDPYLAACTSPESPALARLAHLTRSADWSRPGAPGPTLEAEMLSGHVEGQLLRMLVRATRARRVLEVGMFTGYSALAMAQALPDDGEVVACEIDTDVADFARRCFAESPDGAKVTVRVGPALPTIEDLARTGSVFDLVFVDADKPGYGGYLAAVLDGDLLAPGGLVCVDNTLMQGQPWLAGEPTPNGAAVAAFNRAVADDPRVEQVLLPLRDGITLIQRVDRAAPRARPRADSPSARLREPVPQGATS